MEYEAAMSCRGSWSGERVQVQARSEPSGGEERLVITGGHRVPASAAHVCGDLLPEPSGQRLTAGIVVSGRHLPHYPARPIGSVMATAVGLPAWGGATANS